MLFPQTAAHFLHVVYNNYAYSGAANSLPCSILPLSTYHILIYYLVHLLYVSSVFITRL